MYINSLDYNKDDLIWGDDIYTDYGKIRFLTYKEMLFNSKEVSLISQNVLHIYYYFLNDLKKIRASKEEIEELKEIKDSELIELVLTTQSLLSAYLRIFDLVIDVDTDLIRTDFEKEDEYIFMKYKNILSSSAIFMFVRKLIMDMNIVIEERVSPNEVIQKAFERSSRIKSRTSQKQSNGDVITSIVANTNYSYKDVGEMTVFQVYALYARIGAIFNHKTTTLFATVADKVEVESWNKHINLFEEEQDSMTREQFTSKFGSMLGG